MNKLFATERALVLKKDILVRYYTGMSPRGIAKEYGLEEAEVMATIEASDHEEHVEAEKKASEFPNIAKRRIRGVLPKVTEKLIEHALGETNAKPGHQIRAEELLLEAGGVLQKQSVNQTTVVNVREPTQAELDEAGRIWREAQEAVVVEDPQLPEATKPNNEDSL